MTVHYRRSTYFLKLSILLRRAQSHPTNRRSHHVSNFDSSLFYRIPSKRVNVTFCELVEIGIRAYA
jgi:hypothetical protein